MFHCNLGEPTPLNFFNKDNVCVFFRRHLKIIFKADTKMFCSVHDKAWAASHIDNDEASCSALWDTTLHSQPTLLALSTKCGSHFLVAPSQNALFNYGKPERVAVEKESTVRLGIWGGWGWWWWGGCSRTAGSSMDLTTQGMNRVNGFQNRWPACWSHDLCLPVLPKCKLFTSHLSLIIRAVFLSFLYRNPAPPSHDTARGIIIGYVQRSMLIFNPGLWDRRGPRSLPEHKEWRGQRRYCWSGLLTDRSFFTHCFFQTAILSCKVTPWQPWKV